MSGSAIHDRLDALHVGLPGPIGAAMRVGHLNAELDVLVTKFALSHLPNLLALGYRKTTHRMIFYQMIVQNARESFLEFEKSSLLRKLRIMVAKTPKQRYTSLTRFFFSENSVCSAEIPGQKRDGLGGSRDGQQPLCQSGTDYQRVFP